MAKQRLIDAIRFSRIIKEYRNEFPQRTARQKVCNDILAMLGDETQTPTADAVEVKHSKWEVIIYGQNRNFRDVICPICGVNYACHTGMLQLQRFSYCPNCGAKMDGSGADDARST